MESSSNLVQGDYAASGAETFSVGGIVSRSPGWWRDDSVEQLRNYQSWVYAAVNAIAQEVARQRPFLFVNTGQADHEQTPLPHTHPLARLLDHPNPWMTPWELWYLTILYLELTGNCYWYAAPRVERHARRIVDRADAVGPRRPRSGAVRQGLRGRGAGHEDGSLRCRRDRSSQVSESARRALRPVAACKRTR